MMNGKQVLQNLETTDESLRSKNFMPNAVIKQLQMLIIMNSLCQTKIKMGDCDYLTGKIDFDKSMQILPVIDIVEEKGKKEKI